MILLQVGHVVALDITGGGDVPLWTVTAGSEIEARVQVVHFCPHPPICEPPSVISCDFDGHVRRHDSVTGNTNWAVIPGNISSCYHGEAKQCLSVMANPLLIRRGTQLLLPVQDGPNHGSIYCLDTGSGETLWQVDAGGDLRASMSSPVVNHAVTRIFIGVGPPAKQPDPGGNIVVHGSVSAFILA